MDAPRKQSRGKKRNRAKEITKQRKKACEGTALASKQKKIRADDSQSGANEAFSWLVGPLDPTTFLKKIWEKKHSHVVRKDPAYFQKFPHQPSRTRAAADTDAPCGLFSTNELDNILKTRLVRYGVNIDVTSYTNGERQTHNPAGRAHARGVWNMYDRGCSLRFLNPQAFSPGVWRLCSELQDVFGNFVGANVYLTPPGSQGFAPHYDDVDVFICQLEGSKEWTLHESDYALARTSSDNFTQDEVGAPFFQKTLEAGDMLYLPRGVVHQAKTPDDTHSLHITISTYQMNSWGDFMKKALEGAVDTAMQEDVTFRKGLPVNYLSYMGVAHSDKEDDPRRAMFRSTFSSLFSRMLNHVPLDLVADARAALFYHESLPPFPLEDTVRRTIGGRSQDKQRLRQANDADEDDEVVITPSEALGVSSQGFDPLIDITTPVRLVRRNVARLVVDGDDAIILHTVNNARTYRENDPQMFTFPLEMAPAIETLLEAYPDYITGAELPESTEEQQRELISDLYEVGILMTSV